MIEHEIRTSIKLTLSNINIWQHKAKKKLAFLLQKEIFRPLDLQIHFYCYNPLMLPQRLLPQNINQILSFRP